MHAVPKALGKTSFVYKRYEGLDHNWTDAQGQDQTDRVIGDLLEWLGQLATKKKTLPRYMRREARPWFAKGKALQKELTR